MIKKTTTASPSPAPVPSDAPPTTPPAQICGSSVLNGPSAAPSGAVSVPAGDNSGVSWNQPGMTFWFAPGTHTLGGSQFGQIIPTSNTTFVGAPGAVLDGQGVNDYAFTQHATGVTVEYLTIRGFVSPNDQGVVNHDSGDGWTIQYDSIIDNKGAALMAGANQTVRYNCLAGNGQYGMNAYQSGDGITNLVFDHNEVTGNDADQLPGDCGCAGGVKFWAVKGATVTNNWVHDNHSVGLWADTNNYGLDFEHNYISNNDANGLFYEISYNAKITYNTFIGNALVAGPQNTNFPIGAVYISESGGDSRIDGGAYSTFEIAHNSFRDNWSGVVLWENADRFCGSPANTSSSYCTLVNSSVVKLSTCAQGTINSEPYFSDCRWKTQNVSVHDNSFSLTPANVPGCTSASMCGFNAMFSNWGTYPPWSPYQGPIVQNAIASTQNNHFVGNSYDGPWRMMLHDQWTVVAPT
jgi:hypothetical protein